MSYAIAKRGAGNARLFVARVSSRTGVETVRVPDPWPDGYQEKFEDWRIRQFKTRAAAETVLARMSGLGYDEFAVTDFPIR